MVRSSKRYFAIVLPWLIWIIAGLFYWHQYVLRVSISSLTPEIAHSFHFNALTLSNVSASFFYAYFIMTIPAGILIDRFGIRRMLTMAISCCVIGCFIFASSTNILHIEIARLLMGGGAAFSGVAAMTLTRDWFSDKRFAIVNGFTIAIGTLGGAFGGAPIVKLGLAYGWRSLMVIAGIICIVLALLTALVVTRDSIVTTTINWRHLIRNTVTVIRNAQVWLAAIFAAMLFVPIAVFSSLWGTPFLMAEYSIGRGAASLATTLGFVGFAVGCLLMGWLANSFKVRTIVMPCSLLSLAVMIAILYLPYPPYPFMLLLQFCLGLFVSCSSLAAVAIKDNTTLQTSATAFGVLGAMIPLVAAIILPLTGWLLNNVAIYHLANFHVALAIIPATILVATILTFFIRN